MIERSVKTGCHPQPHRCGLGQIGKGVIYILIQLINSALTAVLIGWVLLQIVDLWAMIDAYTTAKRNNERYGFR